MSRPQSAAPVMRVDSHMHTSRCGHGSGAPRDYLAQAERIGIDVITFTEHVPLPHDLDPEREYAMPPEQWPDYIGEVLELESESVRVMLGAEADWLPGRMDHVRALLAEAQWDVVLGSVHMIDEWPFDDPELVSAWDDKNVDEVWRTYFDVFIDAVRSGLFDVMAHPDLVKKFGHRPSDDPAALYLDAARTLAAQGVAIEVSTAGLRKPCEEIYPSEEFLSICAAEGVSVTTGSDAHRPEEVGSDFDLALGALRRVGYREIVYFEKRQPKAVAL